MDYTVCGILHASRLERVAFPFSRGSSQPRNWTRVSRLAGRFFTSWATSQDQGYWSGYPIPSPADLPNPGIKPGSPALQADSLPTEISGKPYSLCKKWQMTISKFDSRVWRFAPPRGGEMGTGWGDVIPRTALRSRSEGKHSPLPLGSWKPPEANRNMEPRLFWSKSTSLLAYGLRSKWIWAADVP